MTGANDNKPPSNPFDFNTVRPNAPQSEAERIRSEYEAIANVTPHAMRALFGNLENVRGRWGDRTYTEQEAALGALEVVCEFLRTAEGVNSGHFSQPLALLLHELKNAGAADPGNILPPTTSRQTPETARKELVHRGKAAAAFAMSVLMKHGCAEHEAAESIATVLRRFRFPVSSYLGQDRTPLNGADIPDVASVARTLRRWRSDYSQGRGKPAAMFVAFGNPRAWRSRPGLAFDERDLIAWLETQLSACGYEAKI